MRKLVAFADGELDGNRQAGRPSSRRRVGAHGEAQLPLMRRQAPVPLSLATVARSPHLHVLPGCHQIPFFSPASSLPATCERRAAETRAERPAAAAAKLNLVTMTWRRHLGAVERRQAPSDAVIPQVVAVDARDDLDSAPSLARLHEDARNSRAAMNLWRRGRPRPRRHAERKLTAHAGREPEPSGRGLRAGPCRAAASDAIAASLLPSWRQF